jgi:hypothetical protein
MGNDVVTWRTRCSELMLDALELVLSVVSPVDSADPRARRGSGGAPLSWAMSVSSVKT